jgi:predicted transcriptional regulator
MPMVYDPRLDAMVAHGGRGGGIDKNDSWTYSLGEVPSAPLNGTAKISPGRIELDWSPPNSPGSSPVVGYAVYRGTDPANLAQRAMVGNQTWFNDSGLVGGRMYYYRVTANNSEGRGIRSAQVAAMGTGPARAPTGLVAVGGNRQVTVNWTPPANTGGLPITGYRIYRGTAPGVYDANSTAGNVTTHVDGGLAPGTTYYFGVSALNSAGEGTLSAESVATTLSSAPVVTGTVPRNGDVGVALGTQVVVVFSEPMDPVTSFAAFSLAPPLAGALNVTGTVLTFVPAPGLRGNTTHTVTIGGSATSLTGAKMGASHSFSFTTVAVLARLTGRITLDGAPLPASRLDAFRATGSVRVATTTTAPDGTYALVLEERQRYYLEVMLPNGTARRSELFDLEGDRSIDVHVTVVRAPVHQDTPAWLWLTFGLIGTLSTLAIAGWIGGEVVKWMLLLIPIVLYSRIHRDKVLDHFVRGQIYGHIKTNPGATFTEIGEVLGVSNGVLTHHLYTLERMEFVRSEREGRWKRFYARDAPKTRQGVLVSTLQKEILEIIRGEPGISQSDLAERLGTKRQNVNYNVQKLVHTGLVKLEGFGFRKRCLPLGEVERMGAPVVPKVPEAEGPALASKDASGPSPPKEGPGSPG